jgi:hypothetical protein
LAEELSKVLAEGGSNVSAGVRAVGWGAVADALANLDARRTQARLCLTKALAAANELPQSSAERQYLSRVDARMLFLEGRKEEALASLQGQADPKAINLILRMHLQDGRLEEALRILGQSIVCPEIAEAAILIYGEAGEMERAREVHSKTGAHWKAAADELRLVDLDLALAHAYHMRAMRSAGVAPGGRTFITKLEPEVEKHVRESLRLAQPVAERFAMRSDNRPAVEALELCMAALMLLGDHEAAAVYARHLPKEYRTREDVVQALVARLARQPDERRKPQ